MKIIYTRKAKQDLTEVREHYEPRSRAALQNIVADIVSVIDNIPKSVAKGRKTPHPDVWEKITPQYSYLLPYHIHNGKLYILRVYDARRETLDYESVLDLEE